MANTLRVLDMVDAIGAAGLSVIPRGTPVVAPYITGSGGIAWTTSEIQGLSSRGARYVLRIDQTNAALGRALDPYLSVKLLAVDIEPGAENNVNADHIAVRRAAAGLYTVCYVNQANFPVLHQTVSALGDHVSQYVRYWVADWNLDRNGAIGYIEQHEAEGVVAVQYQSLANIDRSVISAAALEGVYGPFRERRHPVSPVAVAKKVVTVAKKVHPKVAAGGAAGVLAGVIIAVLNAHGVHLTAEESQGIDLFAAVVAAYLTPSPQA